MYKLAGKMMTLFQEAWAETGFLSVSPDARVSCCAKSSGGGGGKSGTKVRREMYNKVVKVEGEEAAHAPFYFVLHYVPDLHWCHLAPMRQDGVFPEFTRKGTKCAHVGKKKWRLVPEHAPAAESKEIDVSAERCIVMKRCVVRFDGLMPTGFVPASVSSEMLAVDCWRSHCPWRSVRSCCGSS